MTINLQKSYIIDDVANRESIPGVNLVPSQKCSNTLPDSKPWSLKGNSTKEDHSDPWNDEHAVHGASKQGP